MRNYINPYKTWGGAGSLLLHLYPFVHLKIYQGTTSLLFIGLNNPRHFILDRSSFQNNLMIMVTLLWILLGFPRVVGSYREKAPGINQPSLFILPYPRLSFLNEIEKKKYRMFYKYISLVKEKPGSPERLNPTNIENKCLYSWSKGNKMQCSSYVSQFFSKLQIKRKVIPMSFM